MRDISGRGATVAVSYRGEVPDLFKVGRHVLLRGRLRGATFVAQPDSLVTKCPSRYVAKQRADPTAVPVMALLGSGALALALGLYVYAALAGAWAAARNAKRLQRSARNALLAALPATAAATGALVVAFVRHDFSLVYVANHSSRALPLAYRISALWGGQEGSLLLWLLILAAVAFGAVALNRELVDRTLPWAVPILAALASFFALPARLRLEPVRHADRAGGRRRPEREPAEPLHARPPAAALSRLRRADRAVRVRDGRV